MIKEDLSKLIDDNHKNSYIKCISDVVVELGNIISNVNSNVKSIFECAKNEIKIINDAKKTTEQILGILESSEENFNIARFNFINSYQLWLSECYAPVIISSNNQTKTNSLVQNLPCHDLITNRNEYIIDLEDPDISDVEIVNEIKYLNPRKVFDNNDNVEKHVKLDRIQRSLSQLTASKAKGDLDIQDDPVQHNQSRYNESVSLLDSSFEGIANSSEYFKSESPTTFKSNSSRKCHNQENADVECDQTRSNLTPHFSGSGLDMSALSRVDGECSSLKGKQIANVALIGKKHYYCSDKKLDSKCVVRLERLCVQPLKKFTNCERKLQLFEEDFFFRLIDLSTLEKNTNKKHSSSGSSSSSTCSLTNKKSSVLKKRSKRQRVCSDDSDISSFYESSNSDTDNDYSSYENIKFEQIPEKLDEIEKKAKLRLLEESDTSEDSEEDEDEGQHGNCRKRRKLTKENPPGSKSLNKKSCSTWLNDKLLNFKLPDDKKSIKDLKDFNNLGSASCSDNTAETISSNKGKIISKNIEITELTSKSPFSGDCVIEHHSNCADNDHSNNNLQTTANVATPNSKTAGRRNIRKVLDDQEITENTKQAVKDEESRLERLAERKQQLNYLVRPEEINYSLTLDFDVKTKSKLVAVDRGLVKLLKPHQKEGVRFMWDCCFESVEQVKQQNGGSGCILAHCMGLGKTLQVITLVHTLLVNQAVGVKKVMIVCPMNTILNWNDEFSMWLKHVEGDANLKVVELTQVKQTPNRIEQLDDWQQKGGVLIISYDMFRSLTSSERKLNFVQLRKMKSFLLDPGADLVVCDEGHLLKNEESQLADRMQQVKTQRRIILTGTPLQNNLNEYHCMVQFVKPHLLGCKAEFVNRFANPIANGQFDNSTPHDVKLMKHRAHVLHRLLEGCVQRRDYAVLTPFLPPKQEYVISVRLSEIQKQMYQHYISSVAKVSAKHCNLFKNYQEIKRLVAHPKTMQLRVEHLKGVKNRRGEESHSEQPRSDSSNEAAAADFWWCNFVKDEDLDDMSISHKLALLFGLLDNCARVQDKVLVFSQCLFTLDLIELFLKKRAEPKVSGSNDQGPPALQFKQWEKGLDYFRLDSRVRSKERSNMCKAFNDPANKRTRLFLISTKAGGLGINLTGANRVVVFDPSWNPSNDLQSIFRVFRFGQRKPCYVYRFLTAGTMEEKIYNRQVTKLSLSLRVLDEQQVERHYRDTDLMELYKLEPLADRAPMLDRRPARDHLLAELLSNQLYSRYVYDFFEHESLLENQEEEELDEEERKQAWLEYHQEKLAQPCTSDAAATTTTTATTMTTNQKPRTKVQQRKKLAEPNDDDDDDSPANKLN